MNDNDTVWELDLINLLGAKEEPSSQQLTLYIPHKDFEGRDVGNIDDWIMEARKVLTILGNGSTAMPPADGTWLSPEVKVHDVVGLNDDDVVWEKTTIVYTYINADLFVKYIEVLREFLHRFGRETLQGEVVFEFDGRLYRILKYDNPI